MDPPRARRMTIFGGYAVFGMRYVGCDLADKVVRYRCKDLGRG